MELGHSLIINDLFYRSKRMKNHLKEWELVWYFLNWRGFSLFVGCWFVIKSILTKSVSDRFSIFKEVQPRHHYYYLLWEEMLSKWVLNYFQIHFHLFYIIILFHRKLSIIVVVLMKNIHHLQKYFYSLIKKIYTCVYKIL